jgi:phthiocerol/phenolphthiocerol synthesis type-I polyketide synthase C
VLPAAAMVEAALSAAALLHPEAPVLEVQDLAILRPVTLKGEEQTELRCTADDEGGFTLRTRPRLAEDALIPCARARIATLPRLPNPPILEFTEARQVLGSEVIAFAARHGLDYGPAFRSLQSVARDSSGTAALARLSLPAAAPAHTGFILHPALLDGAVQGLFALLLGQGIGADRQALRPARCRAHCLGGNHVRSARHQTSFSKPHPARRGWRGDRRD